MLHFGKKCYVTKNMLLLYFMYYLQWCFFHLCILLYYIVVCTSYFVLSHQSFFYFQNTQKQNLTVCSIKTVTQNFTNFLYFSPRPRRFRPFPAPRARPTGGRNRCMLARGPAPPTERWPPPASEATTTTRSSRWPPRWTRRCTRSSSSATTGPASSGWFLRRRSWWPSTVPAPSRVGRSGVFNVLQKCTCKYPPRGGGRAVAAAGGGISLYNHKKCQK